MDLQQQQHQQHQHQQQQQQNDNAYYEFQAGVTACLRSWSALRTAVESGWGQGMKAEDIRTMIFSCMDGINRTSKKPITDIIDLEDYLAIYMEEEFSIVLEDDSEKQIACDIFTMYEQCCFQNDFTLSRQIVQNAWKIESTLLSSSKTSQTIQILSPCEDIDDDDDDEDEDLDHNDDKNDPNDDEDDDVDDDNAMDIENDNNQGYDFPISTPNGRMDTPTTSSLPVASATTIAETSATPSIESQTPYYYVAKEFASKPLFGNYNGITNATGNNNTSTIRQLGEKVVPVPDSLLASVDEDGFAPVIYKKKLKCSKLSF